ncbi:acyl-CoA N-acyltransferase [Xylaria bambusicola]|uniref:acyl-CoA N-acyltransferase n=1 Tax=Xylaria bambusicola TaxID=326684 RepID=UPI0020089F16|nr:acyl-CoA N-acyltransferase [Xylaria bambusicola]KAI0522038.1 acyl-CoA N-acyltransferase [Xylaria bambusicola]
MDCITSALAGAFRSKRLVYRAIEDNDADKSFLYTQLQLDPATSALSDPSIHRPSNRKESDQWVDILVSNPLLSVMICLPGDSLKDFVPIGYISIKGLPMYQRRASLSIQIAPAYQNRGYGSEVINWAMDWSFKWGGLHSLTLGASLYNERAVAVYRKAGFRQEGISKEAVYRNRKWWDTVQMAILEQEWEALRGTKN